VKVGVFSCRTPNRPNPIGLTLVKLDRVDKKKFRLFVSGVDLLDGTPVLDIKPFIPLHDLPNPAHGVSLSEFVENSSSLEPDFARVDINDNVRDKLLSLDWARSGLDAELFGRDRRAQAAKLTHLLQEILQWDGRKTHIREEHLAAGWGEWLFEMGDLDFILQYPKPGIVCCVDVLARGEAKYVRGKGVLINSSS
jgi:hypothetical protein